MQRVGNILVLTGPAGTGKSATIDVLSKELNVELQGWNAPVSLTNEGIHKFLIEIALKRCIQRIFITTTQD